MATGQSRRRAESRNHGPNGRSPGRPSSQTSGAVWGRGPRKTFRTNAKNLEEASMLCQRFGRPWFGGTLSYRDIAAVLPAVAFQKSSSFHEVAFPARSTSTQIISPVPRGAKCHSHHPYSRAARPLFDFCIWGSLRWARKDAGASPSHHHKPALPPLRSCSSEQCNQTV
jgi:hypothetical protein